MQGILIFLHQKSGTVHQEIQAQPCTMSERFLCGGLLRERYTVYLYIYICNSFFFPLKEWQLQRFFFFLWTIFWLKLFHSFPYPLPLLRPGWLFRFRQFKNPQQFQVKHKSISEFPSVWGGRGRKLWCLAFVKVRFLA